MSTNISTISKIIAAAEKDVEALKQLQEQGINLNIIENNETALIHAIIAENLIAAKNLLEIGIDIIHFKDSAGLTALHFAACFANEEIMSLIIKRLKAESGYKILDIEDNRGWTPITWAIYYKNYSAVNLFAGAGCNLNKICGGQTYLTRILQNASNILSDAKIDEDTLIPVIETLLKYKADVNKIPKLSNILTTPAIISIEKDYYKIVEILFQNANINLNPDINYPHPLHAAALHTNNKMIRFILSKNAICINLINQHAESALSLAIKQVTENANHNNTVSERLKAAETLALAGADVGLKVKNSTILELVRQKIFEHKEFSELETIIRVMPSIKCALNPGFLQLMANYFLKIYLEKTANGGMNDPDIFLSKPELWPELFNSAITKENAVTAIDYFINGLFAWKQNEILKACYGDKNDENKDISVEIIQRILKASVCIHLELFYLSRRNESFIAPYINQVLFEEGLLQEENPKPSNNIEIPVEIAKMMLAESYIIDDKYEYFPKNKPIIKPLFFSNDPESAFCNEKAVKDEAILVNTYYNLARKWVKKWNSSNSIPFSFAEIQEGMSKIEMSKEDITINPMSKKELPRSETKKLQEVESTTLPEKKEALEKMKCEFARNYKLMSGKELDTDCDQSLENQCCNQCKKIVDIIHNAALTREIPKEEVHLLNTHGNKKLILAHFPLPQGARLLVFRNLGDAAASPWAISPYTHGAYYITRTQDHRAVFFKACKHCNRMELEPLVKVENPKMLCSLSTENKIEKEKKPKGFSHIFSISKAPVENKIIKNNKPDRDYYIFNHDSFPFPISLPQSVLLYQEKELANKNQENKNQSDKNPTDKIKSRLLKKEEIAIRLDDVEMPFDIINNTLVVSFYANPFAKLNRPQEYTILTFRIRVFLIKTTLVNNPEKNEAKIKDEIEKNESSMGNNVNSKTRSKLDTGKSFIEDSEAETDNKQNKVQTFELIYNTPFTFYMSHAIADEDLNSEERKEDDEAGENVKGVIAKRKFNMGPILQLDLPYRGQQILYDILSVYLKGNFYLSKNIEQIKSSRNEKYTSVMNQNDTAIGRQYICLILNEISQFLNQYESSDINLFNLTNLINLRFAWVQMFDYAHSLGTGPIGSIGPQFLVHLLQESFQQFFQQNERVTFKFERLGSFGNMPAKREVTLEVTLTSDGRSKAMINQIISEYLGLSGSAKERSNEKERNRDYVPNIIFEKSQAKLFDITQSFGNPVLLNAPPPEGRIAKTIDMAKTCGKKIIFHISKLSPFNIINRCRNRRKIYRATHYHSYESSYDNNFISEYEAQVMAEWVKRINKVNGEMKNDTQEITEGKNQEITEARNQEITEAKNNVVNANVSVDAANLNTTPQFTKLAQEASTTALEGVTNTVAANNSPQNSITANNVTANTVNPDNINAQDVQQNSDQSGVHGADRSAVHGS